MSAVQDQVFDIMNEGGSKIDLFDFRGTHGGGSEYTTGVTTNGTPGSFTPVSVFVLNLL